MVLFTHPNEAQTNVLVFQPNSRTPRQSKSLPFQLRELAWYRKGSRFSFAGITTSWNVTLLGDDTVRIEDEGSSSNPIKNQTSSARRTTLYQDIFGKSAFDSIPELYPTPSPIEPPNPERLQPFFDSPAHLAPPIESTYAFIMGGFSPKHREPSNDEGIDAGGEDEEMIDPQEPRSNALLPLLDIDDRELESLSQFFRQQCFSRKPSSLQLRISVDVKLANFGGKRGSVNGSTNGTPKPKRNGTHHLTPAEQKRPPEPTQSPPVTAGVKRKISIV